MVEFSSNSGLTETTGTFDKPMSDQIQLLVDTYKYLSVLFQVGLDITDTEGDAPSNDIFTAAKSEIDKTIWMLTAELGPAPGPPPPPPPPRCPPPPQPQVYNPL